MKDLPVGAVTLESPPWLRAVRQQFNFGLGVKGVGKTCQWGAVRMPLGRVRRLRAFQFDGSEYTNCPLRSQCLLAKGRKGRWMLIHPQEAPLQQALALQQSTGYDEYRGRRVVVEHRLARLVHLGIRQSRHFDRVKTKLQLYLAATVANMTLVAGNSDDQARPVAISATEALPAQMPSLPSLISSTRGSVKY